MRTKDLKEIVRATAGSMTGHNEMWLIVSRFNNTWKLEMMTPSAVNSVVAIMGLRNFYPGRKFQRVKCFGLEYSVIED